MFIRSCFPTNSLTPPCAKALLSSARYNPVERLSRPRARRAPPASAAMPYHMGKTMVEQASEPGGNPAYLLKSAVPQRPSLVAGASESRCAHILARSCLHHTRPTNI